ncbi:serine acetyltransferase [Flavobacterium caseinilyticum]|uniref:Serine acetyltransferase n=1 Tax=Flavobacterium caseinilyticum TaxID=2541732 RepID=A0A4R5AS01_9FLAO|nr:serine acetyltransferase [Flavobacterium caseinilyticum]TDD75938.1 serine acetyltransferase [Flavobacterium caseinilyticum]
MKNKSIIYDDLYRYTGERSFWLLLRYVFFTPGFQYVFLFRKTSNADFILSKIFWKILLRRCMLSTGIQIPEITKIDRGFRIVHFGHIVINPATIIGKNFNISHGVTLGHAEGKQAGSPIIGNNVSIQTNAVVVGSVMIGNDVLIAPNAFVNFDVPDGAIVLGNPGSIILKEKASEKYIVYKIE